MEESEKFLSAYHIILYLLILIISIYLLLITTSTPTKENVDIKLLLRQKIQYLQKFYHRTGEVEKCKVMDKLITNYLDLNFEEYEIVNTIEDIASRYQEIGWDIICLELHYEILKIKTKMEPDNKDSIISTWEKIMILNSNIGNKDEARKIFLYIQSLTGRFLQPLNPK
jgi:hypothetical protein